MTDQLSCFSGHIFKVNKIEHIQVMKKGDYCEFLRHNKAYRCHNYKEIAEYYDGQIVSDTWTNCFGAVFVTLECGKSFMITDEEEATKLLEQVGFSNLI